MATQEPTTLESNELQIMGSAGPMITLQGESLSQFHVQYGTSEHLV
jgi:hypothetical protein